MTVCATESATHAGGAAAPPSCVLSADGSYAARLTRSAGPTDPVPVPEGGYAPDDHSAGWFPERWTLGGPEPYTVPLPGERPEKPDSQLLPMADGRVLIARRVERRHELSLLYPTGPDTGEVRLGAIDSERLVLLPPPPGGQLAYALAPTAHSATVWLVAGGAYGPQQVAAIAGRCAGGGWLDPEGRLLALDRTARGSGQQPAKTVTVDLGLGRTSPLLQITEHSEDQLLLADPDSGLLLVRSDAPGETRLGWGVLGSHRPVRFPEALHPDGVRLTPFAVQSGQLLQPESCAVALRADGPNGVWIAVWRPVDRSLTHVTAPEGWLTDCGVWTADGVLRLPYATAHTPCGVAELSFCRTEAEQGPPPVVWAGIADREQPPDPTPEQDTDQAAGPGHSQERFGPPPPGSRPTSAEQPPPSAALPDPPPGSNPLPPETDCGAARPEPTYARPYDHPPDTATAHSQPNHTIRADEPHDPPPARGTSEDTAASPPESGSTARPMPLRDAPIARS